MRAQHMSYEEKRKREAGLPSGLSKKQRKNKRSLAWAPPATVAKPLVTQGHLKAATRFADLLRTPAFMKELSQIIETADSAARQQLFVRFAAKYSLDLGEKSPLAQLARNEPPDLTNPDLDFCRIIKFASETHESPLKEFYASRPNDVQTIELYPVHIGISPLASKRDLLDYVAKRWGEIRWYLDFYGLYPARIRKRPNEERDLFIWEHRDFASSEIIRLLAVQYPSKLFDYAMINTIIKNLRKRYSGK